jgi:ketosteroid isomerase-like protein
MYAWLARRMVRRVMARSRAGDMAPTLALWADDGHFRFPGRSSWAIDCHDKAEIGRWYERFARAGLQIEPHEILVQGGPWNTTMCVHFTDHACDPAGEVVYENHGVLWVKMAWGKIKYGTVYEDTQKVAAFDEYLTAHQIA